MSTARPLLLTKAIPVNVYDIDALSIVSNIVYIRWFEDLRMHLLDTYYPYQELLKDNKSPVLKETHIDYQYPIDIMGKIKGHVWMPEVTKSKWTCAFEIFSEDKVHATGTQIGYFIDVARKRPVRIPERFIALWDQEVESK